jgi:NTP pyrophosphatase (non-canonical NTP hydrolase)
LNYSDFVFELCKSSSEIVKELQENPEKAHLAHMALGVAGEAGELADALKKYAIYGKVLDRENVVEELGDLRFYMQGIMNSLEITEDEVISHNTKKLSKRYSQGSYSNEQAQQRADKE